MNLYFISGLGVDKRLFRNLDLSPYFSIHYIDWVIPLPKESMSEYAKRLSQSIDQSKPFALIGVSFGGMIATEMNRYVKPVKTIIISSASAALQLPWYFRSIRYIPLYKLLPASVIKKPNPIYNWFFSLKAKEEKKLLKEILGDTDKVVLKWSVHAIANWRNEITPANLVHIHGEADKLLPIRFTTADIRIRDGGHFMIYSKAREISTILNDLLKEDC